MQHLTRIVGVPIGVNVLGLLELFAWIGSFVGISLLGGIVPIPVALFGMGTGFIGIAAFDIWWRTRQPEISLWHRLLSPYCGGCFVFLPMWLILVTSFVVAVTALVIKLA